MTRWLVHPDADTCLNAESQGEEVTEGLQGDVHAQGCLRCLCLPATRLPSYAGPIDDQPRKPEMPIIHHVVAGKGRPAVVFVHGFGCAHSGWDAQVAHL